MNIVQNKWSEDEKKKRRIFKIHGQKIVLTKSTLTGIDQNNEVAKGHRQAAGVI